MYTAHTRRIKMLWWRRVDETCCVGGHNYLAAGLWPFCEVVGCCFGYVDGACEIHVQDIEIGRE